MEDSVIAGLFTVIGVLIGHFGTKFNQYQSWQLNQKSTEFKAFIELLEEAETQVAKIIKECASETDLTKRKVLIGHAYLQTLIKSKLVSLYLSDQNKLVFLDHIIAIIDSQNQHSNAEYFTHHAAIYVIFDEELRNNFQGKEILLQTYKKFLSCIDNYKSS